MSDPVSRFRAEVGAVLLRLLEDAVLEITKVFEARSSEPRNQTEPPRPVRSVGVQAGDPPGPAVEERGGRGPRARLGEGPNPSLAMEMVDLLCTVDLPYHIFEEKVIKGEGGDDSSPQTGWPGPTQAGLSTGKSPLKQGLQAPDPVTAELPCADVSSGGSDRSGPAGNLPDPSQLLEELELPETPQLELLETPMLELPETLMLELPETPMLEFPKTPKLELLETPPLELLEIPKLELMETPMLELPETPELELLGTPKLELPETPQLELLETSASGEDPSRVKSEGVCDPLSKIKVVRFQLAQAAPDCKLLQPCSVRLVNLLLAPRAGNWGAPARGQAPPMPRDLRPHRGAHTGRRLCCFSACGNGVWRLQGGAPRISLCCKICGKKFKRRKVLRHHERFHTGERPYSCPTCGKTFALRKNMRRHQRFHTGERPHRCLHCGKSFRIRDNLKVHLRFHSGEKPFACTLCSKGFRVQKNLDKHVLTHSMPVNPYSHKTQTQ